MNEEFSRMPETASTRYIQDNVIKDGMDKDRAAVVEAKAGNDLKVSPKDKKALPLLPNTVQNF